MSRKWNGESLVDELSAFLGDTSTTFKTKTLGWLNDVIFDISSRHDWGNHLVKGKKILVGGEEIQDLEIEAPDSFDFTIASGGAMSAGSSYRFCATFVQDNGVESLPGESAEELTTTATEKSFNLTNIPTSDESLVTKRNIYVSKDLGPYYFHTQIDDNFTTSLDITTDTDSTVEPPDYEAIRRLKGSPFFEGSPSLYLQYRDVDQLRKLIQGQWSLGSPEFFSPLEVNKITTYPIPSSDMEVSFNYFRNPFKLYYTSDSQPDLPIYLKQALKAGVIAMGYEYRDRQGAEIKRANYENSIVDAINRGGRIANIEYAVLDVYGNFNGFEIG
jgi:hypothetical protein